jgi:hypothetical protein
MRGKGKSPQRLATLGPWVGTLQVVWNYPVADEAYVTERGWEKANLEQCPFHPEGGCGLERLGTYPRVEPIGARIVRWWCPREGASISLLPSFLAARCRGTLDAIEHVVARVEAIGSARALEEIHPADAENALSLEGARRSIRRKVVAVKAALLALVTLLPERLGGVAPTVSALRAHLGTESVLVALRKLGERYLGALPVPLGLRPRAPR